MFLTVYYKVALNKCYFSVHGIHGTTGQKTPHGSKSDDTVISDKIPHTHGQSSSLIEKGNFTLTLCSPKTKLSI